MKQSKSLFQIIMERTAVISAAAATILIILYLLSKSAIVLSLTITAGVTCYHFSMRLLVGHIINAAGNMISPSCGWFTPKKWESSVYRLLRVKKWKRHIPTYSPEAFNLNLHSPAEILHTMCVSEAVHEVIILLSFLPILLCLIFGSPAVFCLTSFAAAAVDSVFVILQRYNRPRMARLAKLKEKNSVTTISREQ